MAAKGLLQNSAVWNNKYLTSHAVSEGQESGSSLAGWLWLGFSYEVTSQLMKWRQVTVWRDRTLCFQAQAVSPWWREPSVPHHVAMPSGPSRSGSPDDGSHSLLTQNPQSDRPSFLPYSVHWKRVLNSSPHWRWEELSSTPWYQGLPWWLRG